MPLLKKVFIRSIKMRIEGKYFGFHFKIFHTVFTSKFGILLYTFFIIWMHENPLHAKRLFVLNPEAGIVTEYHPVDLTFENRVQIPEYEGYERHGITVYDFRSRTKDVLVNQSGHILYYKDRIRHHELNGRKFKVRRLCYWD